MQHGTTLMQLMLLPLLMPLRTCLAQMLTAYLFGSSKVSETCPDVLETCPDVLETHGGCAAIAVS